MVADLQFLEPFERNGRKGRGEGGGAEAGCHDLPDWEGAWRRNGRRWGKSEGIIQMLMLLLLLLLLLPLLLLTRLWKINTSVHIL